MISQTYYFQYMWCGILWTVCSEEQDVISMLMTIFLTMKVLCMLGSDIMLLTAEAR